MHYLKQSGYQGTGKQFTKDYTENERNDSDSKAITILKLSRHSQARAITKISNRQKVKARKSGLKQIITICWPGKDFRPVTKFRSNILMCITWTAHHYFWIWNIPREMGRKWRANEVKEDNNNMYK